MHGREARTAEPKAAQISKASQGEGELALINRAQSALRTQPERALGLLESHQARFSDGQFAEEREVLWIDALSQLGKDKELARRAQRFLASRPGSLHRARVKELLNDAARALRGASSARGGASIR